MKITIQSFSFFILFIISGCGFESNLVLPLFQHKIIDPRPNTGKECCTDVLMLGDINGDGNQDVIVGAEHAEGASLVWYQHPTWEKHAVASGEFTTDGQAVDMDQDGDLDIVVGNYTPSKETIDWYENVSGTGRVEWVRHMIGKGFAHDLEVGDMDGDGDIDIVTCDKKKVVLWEQITPVEFREHVILERKGEGVKLADIDGDGDLDIVYGGSWLENPGLSSNRQWISRFITEKWSPDTRVFVVDMNKDGRPDVALSVSEGKGNVSWFESPENPKSSSIWIEHPIENRILEGAHSLQVVDIDNDGDLDVVTAEMHTSSTKRVLVYLNEGNSKSFKPIVLAWTGSHQIRVGDIDNDGDYDIVGKNYAGPGRMIEMWKNQTSNAKKWNYISIDAARPKSQKGMMGLVFTDVDRDGFMDVVAGSFVYRNPSGKLWDRWLRTKLPKNVDIYFAVNIDGDQFSDLIGIAGNTIFWLEALDEKATSWKAIPVGKVIQGGRTQGYIAAKLIPSQKPQLVFTRGKNHLYALEIPPNPEQGSWPLYLISTEAEEEGVAVADIDSDGDLDIAAVKADGQHAIWLENPGTLSVNWQSYLIGETSPWIDRVALADLDGDGKPDFVNTLERQDGTLADSLYWFAAPSDPKQESWTKHVIARNRSLNSMDISDIDGDGSTDIVVAEHTDLKNSNGAPDNLTLIYLNRNNGHSWEPEIVEQGPHSSHLGAKLMDLDNDGVKEIISIGWNQYRYIHLWSKASKERFYDENR
ncbi:MAG: VCBS repeat-containing protein [Candidatus Competibacter sp.]|nr:VCBS repeat-containing protein [Candidatus Competibacter sp.]